MDVLEVIKGRRAVRKFKDKEILVSMTIFISWHP